MPFGRTDFSSSGGNEGKIFLMTFQNKSERDKMASWQKSNSRNGNGEYLIAYL